MTRIGTNKSTNSASGPAVVESLGHRRRLSAYPSRGVPVYVLMGGAVLLSIGAVLGALIVPNFTGGPAPHASEQLRLTTDDPKTLDAIEEVRRRAEIKMFLAQLHRHRDSLRENGGTVDGLDELIEQQETLVQSHEPMGRTP